MECRASFGVVCAGIGKFWYLGRASPFGYLGRFALGRASPFGVGRAIYCARTERAAPFGVECVILRPYQPLHPAPCTLIPNIRVKASDYS